MNKFRIVILGVVALILAVVIIGFTLHFRAATDFATASGGNDTSHPVAGILPTSVPAGDTISIGTSKGAVQVKNFYKNSLAWEDQYIIIAQNSQYEITYDTTASQFFLYIPNSPSDAVRSEYETALLNLLGVSKTDACKLNILEGFSASSPYGTKPMNLSICASAVFSK